jgi:hypothetical protein
MRLVLYDMRPGGVAESAYEEMLPIATAARDLVRDCACVSGCPRCVHDGRCPEHNYMVDKRGATIILGAVVDALTASALACAALASSVAAPAPAPVTVGGVRGAPRSPAHATSSGTLTTSGGVLRVSRPWIASQPQCLLERGGGSDGGGGA